VTRALEQHEQYVDALRRVCDKVIVLPEEMAYPDSVFVEDTCTVVGKKAVIHNLGAKSRKGEVTSIVPVLESLGIALSYMKEPATADGGDVMCTPRHIFVGISSRTNMEGFKFIQQVFSDHVVVPIKVQGGLHLKCVVTFINPNTLVAANDATALAMLDEFKKYKYDVVLLPDASAGNCVQAGNHVLAPSIYPDSFKVYAQVCHTASAQLVPIDISEFAKADGSLTCLSILLD